MILRRKIRKLILIFNTCILNSRQFLNNKKKCRLRLNISNWDRCWQFKSDKYLIADIGPASFPDKNSVSIFRRKRIYIIKQCLKKKHRSLVSIGDVLLTLDRYHCAFAGTKPILPTADRLCAKIHVFSGSTTIRLQLGLQLFVPCFNSRKFSQNVSICKNDVGQNSYFFIINIFAVVIVKIKLLSNEKSYNIFVSIECISLNKIIFKKKY